MKEVDLARPLKIWLEKEGYKDVLTEVKHNRENRKPDLICKHKNMVNIFEMKLGLNLSLLEQCCYWRGKAPFVWAVVPKPKSINYFVVRLFTEKNIGVLFVKENKYFGRREDTKEKYEILEMYEAKPEPVGSKYINYWKDIFNNPLHKNNSEAGSPSSNSWTEYKDTIHKVKLYMQKVNKPVTAREIVANVKTHYKQPVSSLSQALIKHEATWCEDITINKKTHFVIRKGRK